MRMSTATLIIERAFPPIFLVDPAVATFCGHRRYTEIVAFCLIWKTTPVTWRMVLCSCLRMWQARSSASLPIITLVISKIDGWATNKAQGGSTRTATSIFLVEPLFFLSSISRTIPQAIKVDSIALFYYEFTNHEVYISLAWCLGPEPPQSQNQDLIRCIHVYIPLLQFFRGI